MNSYLKLIVASCFLSVFFSSCTNTKKVTYFNALTDDQIQYQVQNLEPVIQKNDLLNIIVNSVNGEANQMFNLYSVTMSLGNPYSGTVIQTSGFLVDQDGYIQYPVLGAIKAAGLTKKELKDIIVKGLVAHNVLYDPIVSIRYLNYKVTVLGEVGHPAVINVPNEKITILEALGLAGDLTIYGQRNNVLLLREEADGKRISHHIDLTSKDILYSPFFYLKSNDVLYVAPNKANVASASTTKLWLPAVFGAMTFLTVVLDKVIK